VPLGVALARTAKAASAAFDSAMSEAGGSLPIWLVLVSLKSARGVSQRAMAESMGIQGATLTHHLNAMEADGLITRQRDPANRRVREDRRDLVPHQLADRAHAPSRGAEPIRTTSKRSHDGSTNRKDES